MSCRALYAHCKSREREDVRQLVLDIADSCIIHSEIAVRCRRWLVESRKGGLITEYCEYVDDGSGWLV